MALKPSYRGHDYGSAAMQAEQMGSTYAHGQEAFLMKEKDTYYTYSPSSSSLSLVSQQSEAYHPRSLPTGAVRYHDEPLTTPQRQSTAHRQPPEDLPPIVTNAISTSSVDTYDSEYSRAGGHGVFDDDDEDEDYEDVYYRLGRCPPPAETSQQPQESLAMTEEDAIPVVLPPYRASVVDPTIRPSTPRAFGRLFPSLDRLSVKHDDLTSDGNMNLRVDTLVPASALVDDDDLYESEIRRHPGARRPLAIQLYHLRMHDLPRREFSLRRYCRESGREVCSSKRLYEEIPTLAPRPDVRRSVSSVLRSVATPFQRTSSHSTHHGPGLFHRRPSTGSRRATTGSSATSTSSGRGFTPDDASRQRRDSVTTAGSGGRSEIRARSSTQLVSTETMRLEFSNYARVDVTRIPGKGYGFEWWGSHYVWRRAVDQNVEGAVSFHLLRDRGRGTPTTIAHIVPENRSPNQITGEEEAGGWVPPCHLWISDESVLDAATDIADVIVGTGLLSLVDDRIKERWPTRPPPRRSSFGFSNTARDADSRFAHHRSIVGGIFHRRHSDQQGTSPLRFGRPVAVY